MASHYGASRFLYELGVTSTVAKNLVLALELVRKALVEKVCRRWKKRYVQGGNGRVAIRVNVFVLSRFCSIRVVV